MAMLALAAAPTTLAAQQSAETRPPTADSTHRISPIGAFWRSLVIPGWGQAATGRWVTGAVFTAWEGVCITMTFKTQGEAEHIRASGAGHITTKKQEVQDWTILWFFNHLFAGAEAFVAAHLIDFPPDLHIRAVPRGLMVSMPLPRQ
jgi:hypothetical protein